MPRSTNDHSPFITITLPELTPENALVVLDIIEAIHSKLWRLHGDAIVELLRLRNEAPSLDDSNPDDDLPF